MLFFLGLILLGQYLPGRSDLMSGRLSCMFRGYKSVDCLLGDVIFLFVKSVTRRVECQEIAAFGWFSVVVEEHIKIWNIKNPHFSLPAQSLNWPAPLYQTRMAVELLKWLSCCQGRDEVVESCLQMVQRDPCLRYLKTLRHLLNTS